LKRRKVQQQVMAGSRFFITLFRLLQSGFKTFVFSQSHLPFPGRSSFPGHLNENAPIDNNGDVKEHAI
jgi:hypothetical protein